MHYIGALTSLDWWPSNTTILHALWAWFLVDLVHSVVEPVLWRLCLQQSVNLNLQPPGVRDLSLSETTETDPRSESVVVFVNIREHDLHVLQSKVAIERHSRILQWGPLVVRFTR